MPLHKMTKNDIAQLNPNTTRNQMFAGCFMTVTEIRPWGVQGYVQALGRNGKPGGQAYYRAKWNEIEHAGKAIWVISGELAPLEETHQVVSAQPEI